MPYVTMGDQRLFYSHRGHTGPAVVFIHGAGGDHTVWVYQMAGLAAQARLYALDLPGHGRSPGPGATTIAAYAHFVVTFLDTLRLAPAFLIGHSMGGAIAQQVALDHPGRVAGLGLVATGARLRVAPVILETIQNDYPAAIQMIGMWAYGPGTPADLITRGQKQMQAVPATVVHGDFLACDAFDRRSRLREITCPAVIICGEADQLTPVKFSVFLQENLTGARLTLLPGAGHMVMLEQPDAVNTALIALIAPAAAPGKP